MLASLSLFGLLSAIAVNIGFLYVIFKCYQWMMKESAKSFSLNTHPKYQARFSYLSQTQISSTAVKKIAQGADNTNL
ncbi:unnamed protein product [Thelazia callipaeda]|uniref:Uncharacterized protein n=1 Tax=Thelazia callipaeda TaxID=103827 RepID=A0A0N5CMG2_THECL|nr:unnamed protein product [Thelazia callipaeda]